MAVNFYEILFKEEGEGLTGHPIRGLFKVIPRDLLNHMNKEITKEEIHQALLEMGPYKAPGPNGYQPIFFQKHWEVVGKNLVSFVK